MRSLLSTLDGFENQRPAFTREGDVYPEKRLNRAHATKKHMLVEECDGGMLKAIPGGSAGGWTAGVILKVAGSEEERYYEFPFFQVRIRNNGYTIFLFHYANGRYSSPQLLGHLEDTLL